MDFVSSRSKLRIFRKTKKFCSSFCVSHKIINYYSGGNHKMYRTIKNGRNTGLFKMDNEAPMEWILKYLKVNILDFPDILNSIKKLKKSNISII